MGTEPTSEEKDSPKLIAGRYRVESRLGHGGMAVVYLVTDTSTKRRVALKRLSAGKDDEKVNEATELFEHEFYTLSQLAHPRVIEVYDYGLDSIGPFYTMEFLDGGDLRELSPLPWRRVCKILRDICSPLSLIHSRRLVHRDLTPHNIRCTQDGQAKLIDFGAMVPMGTCKSIVGTPPFVAPEVVNLQPIDARVDLFSLGATAYYALTGHHAFPASSFHQLRILWNAKPTPPSRIVNDIPKDLDHLVLSLLNLDPIARLSDAAEVMERLTVIANLEMDDQLVMLKSYLSTPSLTGREKPLKQIGKQVGRALHNRGSTIIIEGSAGVGRSRFLDACVLEGKLCGTIVLRADARDSHLGEYGVVRALAAQLLDALPEEAMEKARTYLHYLEYVLPELCREVKAKEKQQPFVLLSKDDENKVPQPFPHSDLSDMEDDYSIFDSSNWYGIWGKSHSSIPPPMITSSKNNNDAYEEIGQYRPHIQAALRNWILDIACRYSLMLAIDDLHRIDEPSLALIALLANEAEVYRLIIIVTVESGTQPIASSAIKLISDLGIRITLQNLKLDNTLKLLRSVFGDVPNLHFLANKLQGLSDGNPRNIMQFAQHLVDKKLVRYRSGVWNLPSVLDMDELPHGFIEELEERIIRLTDEARQMVAALSLSPQLVVSLAECRIMSGLNDSAKLHSVLDELVKAQVFVTDGYSYAFTQQAWATAIMNKPVGVSRKVLHIRLAKIYDRRDQNGFRLGLHLLKAGEEERAIDVLLSFLKTFFARFLGESERYTEFIHAIPHEVIGVLETALEVSLRRRRPLKDSYDLQRILVMIGLVKFTTRTQQHLNKLIELLYQDSGLSYFDELDGSLEPSVRLDLALKMAQERYDATEESQRILSPIEAITDLTQILIQAASLCVTGFDYTLWESLPSVKPFVSLLKPLLIMDLVVQSVGHVIAGQYETSRQRLLSVLDRIAEPDGAGLDEVHHKYARLNVTYALGLIDAGQALPFALDCADQLEEETLHEVNAWKIRMIYYLRQGDSEQARNCRKRAELIQIQNSSIQFYEGTSLWVELTSYALANDLRGVKQILDRVKEMAEQYPSWFSIFHLVRGEYQRIRGNYIGALEELEKSLALGKLGRHVSWVYAAYSHLMTLFELCQYQEVKVLAEQRLLAAREADLGYMSNYFQMALALAEAKLQNLESAIKRSQSAIINYESLGTTGINLGLAYETRARVAIYSGDYQGFLTYTKLCARQYRVGVNPALTSKYERLLDEARYVGLGIHRAVKSESGGVDYKMESIDTMMETVLVPRRVDKENTLFTLERIVANNGALGGYLYSIEHEGVVVLMEQDREQSPPSELEQKVKDLIQRHQKPTDEGQNKQQLGADCSLEDVARGLSNTENQAQSMAQAKHSLGDGTYSLVRDSCSGLGIYLVSEKWGDVVGDNSITDQTHVEKEVGNSLFSVNRTQIDMERMTITSVGFNTQNMNASDWILQDGQRYRPLFIGRKTERGLMVTGIVVLCLGLDEI